MLELTGNRNLAFKLVDGRVYRFTLSPITPEMWLRYFDSIISTSESRGREQLNDYDQTTPMATLVRGAVLKARGPGYPESAAQAPHIRLSHCEPIGNLLTQVAASTDTADTAVMGLDEARLEAVWSCNEAGNRILTRPLIHHFETPSFDHERRFMRARGRSKIVGGSRTGKTIWMGTQRTLVELYDELIREVEGYTAGGSALTGTPAIVSAMDAYHKVVAAQMLFQVPGQPEEAEAAEEEVA